MSLRDMEAFNAGMEAVAIGNDKCPSAQYRKIQDFVIENKLFKGHPDTMSHADIIILIAKEHLNI